MHGESITINKILVHRQPGLKVPGSKDSYLVYLVHPLPETMTEYVWDFGHLTANEEQQCIRCVVIFYIVDTHRHIKNGGGYCGPICTKLR